MNQQISTLQEQVNSLFSNMSELRSQRVPTISPSFDDYSNREPRQLSSPGYSESYEPSSKRPRYQGPTSSAFNFDLANSSLKTMGMTIPENASPPASPQPSPTESVTQLNKDPIWTIKREEAFRLLQVYDDEVGILYPMVPIADVYSQTNLLYTFVEAAVRTGFANQAFPGADALQDDNTNILKMLMAIALVVEGAGSNELGQSLYECVKPLIKSRLWEPPNLKTTKLIALAVWLHLCI